MPDAKYIEMYRNNLQGEIDGADMYRALAGMEEFPEEEAEKLALTCQAQGIPPEQAAELAASVMRDAERALDTMAREELGIDPDDLGDSPQEVVIGAILPVLPFFFASGVPAIAMSPLFSGLGLFGLVAGAITSGIRPLLGVAVRR